MKKIKNEKDKIISIIKKVKAGVRTKDICKEYNINTKAFYELCRKYSNMELSEVKRFIELEEENEKLRKIIADQALEIKSSKDILKDKF